MVTPRQACPQPKGFGRNLRSKTRWFTGFCNSHQVSHFATFFIDAGAEISVAESRSVLLWLLVSPAGHRLRSRKGEPDTLGFLGAFRAVVFVFRAAGRSCPSRRPRVLRTRSRVNPCLWGIDNDPSAGSPTETLLRLLLPLNDKVQWTSHNVAGGEPPTSPRSEHFTGPFNR